MARANGMNGSVTLASKTYCVTGWTADDESDLQDVTCTGSSGKVQMAAGLRKLSGSFDAQYEVGNRPNKMPGESGALVLNADSGLTVYNITDAIISKISVKSVVGQIVNWTADFHANTWTDPGTT